MNLFTTSGLFGLGLVLLIETATSSTWGASPSSADAVAHYRKGLALIESKRYDDALVELQTSYRELASPNTLLLMAHAHRELGHARRAAEMYEQVVRDAQARIDAGEKRFEQTKADASNWLEELKKSLGKLKVTLLHVPQGTEVRVDGRSVAVKPSSDGEQSVQSDRMWWPVGRSKVSALVPGEKPAVVDVEIEPGQTTSVTLDIRTARRETREDGSLKQGTKSTTSTSISTGTWVGLGVGAVGVGSFALFGTLMKNKTAELDACAPNCSEDMRSTADEGRTYQTLANAGLAVGVAGLATAAGFYLFDRGATEQGNTTTVAVGPSRIVVTGRF